MTTFSKFYGEKDVSKLLKHPAHALRSVDLDSVFYSFLMNSLIIAKYARHLAVDQEDRAFDAAAETKSQQYKIFYRPATDAERIGAGDW